MADVNAIIDAAREFASSSLDQSKTLVEHAVSTIDALSSPVSFFGPEFLETPPVVIPQDIPALLDVPFDVPVAPTPVAGLQQPDLQIGPAPINTAVRPVFLEPSKPADLQQLGVSAPVIDTSFTFPDPPIGLDQHFDPPVLVDHVVPDAPQLLLPVFSAIKPNDDITAPTDFVERFAAAYSDQAPSMYAALNGQMDVMLARFNPRFAEQMAALEDRLATFMAGGSALTPAVENRIYERTKGKIAAESRRSRDTAYGDAARRGFVLPNGALNAAISDARLAGADNNARATSEIAIKQAELEQQNLQFAVTTSANLRTTILGAAISYHQNLIAINGQALEYAKAVLDAAVQVYDTLVKAFSAKLEAYKAEAAVYETQLKGALALVQVYQAEIAALEALTRVDSEKVNVFRAQLESLESLARVYRSKVDVVLGRAEIEKMKIELFGEQVRAFGVEAQAKAAEWQGYSAAVSGQEAIQRAYGEQVRAFSAEVDGYRATVQAKTSAVQLQMSFNEGLVRQYAASVDGYRAAVDAAGRVATTRLDVNRQGLATYQARVTGAETQARTTLGFYQAKASIATDQSRIVLQAAIENARQNTERVQAVANTSVAGARVYEGLASAALSGMNTLVTAT